MNGSQQIDAGTRVAGPRPTVAAMAPVKDREPRPWAKRRLVVGAGGIAVAVALGGFATLMRSNATFAEDNVARQLAEQEITFKPADALTPEEREHRCLVEFAGQPLTTGAQAQCYANHFIGVHLKAVAGGKTFSQMRAVQDDLRAKIAVAQASNDPSVPDLQRQLGEATGKRQTLFEGETMRGLLMTSYGFGMLGSKADQAAGVATWAGAALLGVSVLVLAGTAVRGGHTP